jgi:hypothetical protein
MLSSEERKAAIRAYKERKPRPGIYGVRLTATGRCWAGSCQNLDTTKNGLWGTLNSGRHLDRTLQEEWNSLGETAFEYVILEALKEDVHPLAVKDLLKEKKRYWTEKLSA